MNPQSPPNETKRAAIRPEVPINTKRASNPRNLAIYLGATAVIGLGYFMYTKRVAQEPTNVSLRPKASGYYNDVVKQMEAGSATRANQLRDDSYQNPNAARDQPGSRLGAPPRSDVRKEADEEARLRDKGRLGP